MRAAPDAIDAFDPLLRDLLTWGLVTEVPGEEGPEWHLTANAQRRVSELVRFRGAPPAEHLVYLGRRCAVCGMRRLTRLRDRGYVCEDCTTESVEPQVKSAVQTADAEAGAGARARHAHRKRPSQGASLAS